MTVISTQLTNEEGTRMYWTPYPHVRTSMNTLKWFEAIYQKQTEGQ